MKVNKIGLAWIAVTDVARMTDFFSRTVGLGVSNFAPEFGWAELVGHDGGMILGLGQVRDESDLPQEQKSPIKPGQNAVITLTIDHIEQAKAELESKGVKFVGDIVEVPGHVKMATFTDLDGNLFQLVQEL